MLVSPAAVEPPLANYPHTDATTATLDLIRFGVHPDQLALDEYHQLDYQAARRARVLKSQGPQRAVLDPRPPNQRRLNLPEEPLPVVHLYVRKPLKFALSCSLTYHVFAFDRIDIGLCENQTCQQRMRFGTGGMQKPRNKAWQILNYEGSRSSTRG